MLAQLALDQRPVVAHPLDQVDRCVARLDEQREQLAWYQQRLAHRSPWRCSCSGAGRALEEFAQLVGLAGRGTYRCAASQAATL
ncbi:hypothetical protein D3C75_1302650 [compost metagenome]